MMRALLLLLSCLADYETIQNLARGVFTSGLVNMGAFFCIGAVFVVRRLRLIRG
jgi:hypothetical protein